MVVQHNLQAMNANRMLGITTGQASKSTEKLSSGYRINKAADDAAGLAISEKMRKQIRGLTQASANSEDGISCVQTAEGALAEVQDMLQRMNELCVQAANGTNSKTDRKYIQDEIDQLISEVDRVAETTKFNETYLLKGDDTKATKSTYVVNYSTTYTANLTSNADENTKAVDKMINYIGKNNIIFAKNDILTANNSSKMAAYVVGEGDDITRYLESAKVQKYSIDYSTSSVISADPDPTNRPTWSKYNSGTPTVSLEDILKDLEFDDPDNPTAIQVKSGVTYYYNDGNTPWGNVDPTEIDRCFKITTPFVDASGNDIASADLVDYFAEDGTYKGELHYIDKTGNISLADNDYVNQFVNKTPEIEVKYKKDPSQVVALNGGAPLPTWYLKGSATAATKEELISNLEIVGGNLQFKAGIQYFTAPADPSQFGQQNPATGGNLVTQPLISNSFGTVSDGLFKKIAGSPVSYQEIGTNTELATYFDDEGKYHGDLYRIDDNGNYTLVGAEQILNYVNVTPKQVPMDGLANTCDAQLGKSWVAFINCELNSNVQRGVSGAVNGDELYDLSTNGVDEVVRANKDLFIFDTKNETMIHLHAGDSMADYLKDDNTMEERYRLVDILDSRTAAGGIDAGTSKRVKEQMLGGVDAGNFAWTDNYLEKASSIQKLYNANGKEVSGMKLNEYFDENGNYMGGLYTTAQARIIDEVFADETSDAYKNVTSLLGRGATLIDNYISKSAIQVNDSLALNLHSGSDSDRANKVNLELGTLTAAGLGIDKLASFNIGIVDETGENATDAIDVVASALQKVSEQRAALGAIQNRLEHTIKNLDNIVENTTAAESQIRDTDMAEEMVKQANTNILMQAGQSMLAQANQSNQGVLSLLQ